MGAINSYTIICIQKLMVVFMDGAVIECKNEEDKKNADWD